MEENIYFHLFYWANVGKSTAQTFGTVNNTEPERVLKERRREHKKQFGKVLLVTFSACGGKRTGSKLPVLTDYFPVLPYDI